jgi:hypothetical protein
MKRTAHALKQISLEPINDSAQYLLEGVASSYRPLAHAAFKPFGALRRAAVRK